jgi:hypothetical protein
MHCIKAYITTSFSSFTPTPHRKLIKIFESFHDTTYPLLYDELFFLEIWYILALHKVGVVDNWHRPEWNWQLLTQTAVIQNLGNLASDLENETFHGRTSTTHQLWINFMRFIQRNHEEEDIMRYRFIAKLTKRHNITIHYLWEISQNCHTLVVIDTWIVNPRLTCRWIYLRISRVLYISVSIKSI